MAYDFFDTYERVLYNYLINKSKLISEVCITVLETTGYSESVLETLDGRKITIKKQGHVLKDILYSKAIYAIGSGHSIGLHKSLEMATQEYVLFQDTDVFWYEAVDQFYYDLMTKHDLNIVGVSHPWSHALCFTFFPTVISCMVKRSTLPDKDYLKGKLFAKPGGEGVHICLDGNYQKHEWEAMNGYWLLSSPILEYVDRFPNKIEKQPIFDVGCNLWLWNQDRDGKWLSFQTLDCHNYTTNFYRNNFKLKDKFKNTKFLYHLTSGYNEALQKTDKVSFFEELYKESKK